MVLTSDDTDDRTLATVWENHAVVIGDMGDEDESGDGEDYEDKEACDVDD